MFPYVNPQQWMVALSDGRILIRGWFNAQCFVSIHHQPGPPAAKLADSGFGQLLFEGAKTAKMLIDGCGQRTLWFTSIFLEHQPEKGVVVVTSSLVAHGGADFFRDLIQMLEQVINRLAANFRKFGGGFVQVGDIGGVMLVVMELHGARVDERFERVVSVRQRR